MSNRFFKICWLTAVCGILVSQTLANAQTNNFNGEIARTNKFVWTLEQTTYQGASDTNGLAFGFSTEIYVHNKKHITTQYWAYICNQSTNGFYYWHDSNVFPQKKLIVELFDSKGHPVKKTPAGNQYTNAIDVKQLTEIAKNRYRLWTTGRARTTGFSPLAANSKLFPFFSFNPSELFDLRQPGEYTLHMQIPLIERGGNNESSPEIKVIWLPEVVARVQIYSEAISSTNLPSQVSTNKSVQ